MILIILIQIDPNYWNCRDILCMSFPNVSLDFTMGEPHIIYMYILIFIAPSILIA